MPKEDVHINIKGDASKAISDAKQASSAYDGLAKAAKGATIAFTAVAAATAAVGAGLIKLAKDAANLGDKYAKMSQQVGLSVETLSAFDHAAKISGTTIETVAMGLKNLAARSLDVTQGLLESKRSFDSLGIEVTDVNGELKDAEKLFLEVADKIGNLTNETEKVAIATEIFGRAGMKLIPMFNQGADGIRALLAESDELGLTWNQETAKAAEDLVDSMTRLQGAFTGLKTAIGVELFPVFEELLGELTDYLKDNREEIVRYVREGLGAMLEGLADVIEWVDKTKDAFDEKSTTVKVGAQVLTGQYVAAWQTVRKEAQDADTDFTALTDTMRDLAKVMTEDMVGPPKALMPEMETPGVDTGAAEGEGGVLVDALFGNTRRQQDAFDSLSDKIDATVEHGKLAVKSLEPMTTPIMDEMEMVFEGLRTNMESTFTYGLDNIFMTIGQGSDAAQAAFKNMGQNMLKVFTDMISKMIVQQLIFDKVREAGSIKQFLLEKGKLLASAFGHTYSSIAAIPVVGPFLAPAAAAAAVIAVGAGIKNLAGLAEGGITTGPMIARIGDNPSGREAVIPLDDEPPIQITFNYTGPADPIQAGYFAEVLADRLATEMGK